MIDVAEHLAAILAAVRPLEPEPRGVAEARGRVLRHPVLARVDVPGFDSSAMDGFAVREVTGPATLRVIADLPAGTQDDPRMDAGEAARIMTGAPVPTDATAVVPFEDTERGLAGGLGDVTVLAAPRGPGAHIRRRGSDVREGDLVVADGIRLTAARLGAIAAAIGIFLPVYVFTVIPAPWFSRNRDNAQLKAFVQGATAAATGALSGAVVVIALTGALQVLVFLPTPRDLLASSYGLLVLGKLTGLGVLVAFGARNRFRLLPILSAGGPPFALRRSVRAETVVMAAVILLAAFLGYVPPPEPAVPVARAVTQDAQSSTPR